MTAYGEFRSGMDKDKHDTRFVFYGFRYILEQYLHRPWTMEDLEQVDAFFRNHLAPNNSAFPYPKDLFLKFVAENNGYFPVQLQCLREGTVANARVPVYQITAKDEYARLVTYLETLLTQVWYPCTVATLSRRAKDVIAIGYEKTVDEGSQSPILNSALHDFGFRGCTCVEQSVIGGTAHLLNFCGTDTMSAAFYAQFHLNQGHPVAGSIPASEHSVMTSWETESAAVRHLSSCHGDGMFSVVADSYDYVAFLRDILPPVVAEQRLGARGGYLILRPDSGDPVECVIQGLQALDKVLGSTTNTKGYKVINGGGIIQGDGINIETIRRIVDACIKEGFSVQSVAFGMGGGLLQKVNRDSMSFATKLCHIIYKDGTERDAMKRPTTDSGKISLPGKLQVRRLHGVPTVFPADLPEQELPGDASQEPDLLQVVYDCGPLPPTAPCSLTTDTFDQLRQRVETEWHSCPKNYDPISTALRTKIDHFLAPKQ